MRDFLARYGSDLSLALVSILFLVRSYQLQAQKKTTLMYRKMANRFRLAVVNELEFPTVAREGFPPEKADLMESMKANPALAMGAVVADTKRSLLKQFSEIEAELLCE